MERALKREEDLKRVRDIHSALTDQLNKMKVEADAILENLGNMKTRLEDVIEYPKMLKTRKEYLEQKENGNHINPKQPK